MRAAARALLLTVAFGAPACSLLLPDELSTGSDGDVDGDGDTEGGEADLDPQDGDEDEGDGDDGAALDAEPDEEVCVPAVELCNGLDDDCDGLVDEDFECVAGSSEPCLFCGLESARTCLPSCEWDECVDVCPIWTPTCCDEHCVDTDFDERHCGHCGNACDGGAFCVSGECTDLTPYP